METVKIDTCLVHISVSNAPSLISALNSGSGKDKDLGVSEMWWRRHSTPPTKFWQHYISKESEHESRSVVSNSLQPHGLYTVHGILQARILEWVAFSFSRGSSQPKDQTQVSRTEGGFFTAEPPGKPTFLSKMTKIILHFLGCFSHNKHAWVKRSKICSILQST